MEDLGPYLIVAVLTVIFVFWYWDKEKDKARSVSITCPRCGYHGTKDTYKPGSSALVGCFLLMFFLIPGIFYLALFGNKLVCPKCDNKF